MSDEDVSSAKIMHLVLFRHDGRLIYFMNRSGPRTLPWGTPHDILDVLDEWDTCMEYIVFCFPLVWSGLCTLQSSTTK